MSQDVVRWEELLALRAAEAPDAQACAFLEAGQVQQQWSYAELLRRSDAIAAWLQQRFAPGQRLVLLFPAGLDVVEAFFGCTRAGLIPVPLSPSLGRHQYASIVPILENCGAAAVLGLQLLVQRQQAAAEATPTPPSLLWLSWQTVKAEAEGLEHQRRPASQGGVAFLQYTSGSTGDPKGVRVEHGNLFHNLSQIVKTCGTSRGTSILSWLPHFHDMGLIGGILHALYLGAPLFLMSPSEFLRRPRCWLEAISAYRIGMTMAPDSALYLCQQAVLATGLKDIDLSCLQVLVCGSEPIRTTVLDRFHQSLHGTGLRDDVILCGYGLAEATLMVASGRYHHDPAQIASGSALARSGPSIGGQMIQIVDPHTLLPVEEGEEGLIMVKGPSVTSGYWNQSEANGSVFNQTVLGQPGFLNTGDLGRLIDGSLVVSGRIKDLIIVAGRKIHPNDVESFVLSLSTPLVMDRCMAFSCPAPDRAEQLVVLIECQAARSNRDDRDLAQPNELDEPRGLASLAAQISHEFSVQLADLMLLKPHALPLTTSGKLRRQETKRLYRNNQLQPQGRWRAASEMNQQAVDMLPMIKRALVAVADLDPFVIDADQQLAELIQGSLMLAALKVQLDQQLVVDLPIEPFLADLTLRQLAAQLSDFVAHSRSAESGAVDAGASASDDRNIFDDSQALRQLRDSGLPDHLRNYQLQHGDFVTLRWGRQLIHLLSDPREVQALMQRPEHEFIRGKTLDVMQTLTDDQNLFTSEGQVWQKERHRAQPLFTRQAVEAMAFHFSPIARNCLQQALATAGSFNLDLAELSRSITLQITLQKLFGPIAGAMAEKLDAVLQEVADWPLPLHYLASADLQTATGAAFRFMRPMLEDIADAAIAEQLSLQERPSCLLAAYLEDAEVQAMEVGNRCLYLRSAMVALLLAGLDSTGSALYFSLDLLARHPDIQQRVREEVRGAVVNGEIGFENLPRQLPYTLAAIQEALRLYPPVWFLGREALVATTIMGRSISAGDIVLTSPYVIHRHPGHWQDPHSFQPERFLNQQTSAPATSLYMPFGVGPRTCVGRWLALYEISLAVAALLEQHALSSDGEERPELSSYFTLKTVKPITLRVQPCC